MTVNFQKLNFIICINYTFKLWQGPQIRARSAGRWKTLSTPDSFPLQSSPPPVTSIPHVRRLRFQQIHTKYTLLSRALPWWLRSMGVHVCQLGSIVNETLTQIQHRQIFTARPGDFITDKSVILQEALYFSLFARTERTLKFKLVWGWWMSVSRKYTAFDL